MGSSDVTPTLLWSIVESLEEFIGRCWQDSAAGCHQVLWHFFDKNHIDLERFRHLDHQISRALNAVA
eukprot:682426-Alexandrium_andersonii.AAC.1